MSKLLEITNIKKNKNNMNQSEIILSMISLNTLKRGC